MNDEEIIKLLELAANSVNQSVLTDEVVDRIITRTVECPQERAERIRKRYVEKLFEDLNPKPVDKIEGKSTFGRWIEAARNKVHLSRTDVAGALSQEPVFIEKLERGETLPWGCKPEFVADLMNLFRVHLNAVNQLIAASASVNQTRGVGGVAARSRGGKATKDRGESTARALELFLAHNAAPAAPDADVKEWTERLRGVLKERNLNYLIESEKEAQ